MDIFLVIAAVMVIGVPAGKEDNSDILPNVKVQHLVVDSDHVEIDLNTNAPQDVFRKGPCLIIRGLVSTSDKLPRSDIIDFTMQRQEFKIKAQDFKTAKWKTVNIKTARKVLSHCTEFSKQTTQQENCNPVITMPLPKRKDGEWGKRVLHPQLAKKHQKNQDDTLLFRYIDFSVKPGFWYRYRVQFEMRNPGNRGTTKTKWSDPSALCKN